MRAVVNLATGRYLAGQNRLANICRVFAPDAQMFRWQNFPPGSPSHASLPYAFKAYALKHATDQGFTTLLWADSCILPTRPLGPLFERIERDGYWITRNGWTNYEWTAQSAYRALGVAPEENRGIPHVVATAFGLSLSHPVGAYMFDEYWRLAQTDAFAGPWWNKNHPEYAGYPPIHFGNFVYDPWAAQCGPPDVRGHRHDQTALSVIAARAGCVLDDPPAGFAYRGGEKETTFLVADSNY